MSDMVINGSSDDAGDKPQHLKRVSRIKHVILQKYLPAWAIILGSRHQRLAYFDCFAGPGQYEWEGRVVAGSPIIAVESAIAYLRQHPTQNLTMCLIEDDQNQVAELHRSLTALGQRPKNLTLNLHCTDSKSSSQTCLEKKRGFAPLSF